MNYCIHNINGRGNWMVRGCRVRRFTEMLLATSLTLFAAFPTFALSYTLCPLPGPHPPSDLSLSLAPRRRMQGIVGVSRS